MFFHNRKKNTKALPLTLWNHYWQSKMKYHRYQAIGLENLDQPTSCLIAGYHGRSAALDLCMLSVKIQERFGYMPHAFAHRAFKEIPILNKWFEELGFVYKDGPELSNAIDRKEHLLTTPGGNREGFRSFRIKYQVDWGERLGYLRLAIKHKLSIIPVGAHGVDDVFLGLNDGYQWSKKVGIPMGMPLWLAMGPTGVWPFSLPFPVRITQIIGKPISPEKYIKDSKDPKALYRFHQRIMISVQRLINQARLLSKRGNA